MKIWSFDLGKKLLYHKKSYGETNRCTGHYICVMVLEIAYSIN